LMGRVVTTETDPDVPMLVKNSGGQVSVAGE
jgi:hypothetical protein